jgi:ubiquinone biosynthesis protein
MGGFGFDAGTLAARLMSGSMRQILEQHFYCADVHPQNLLLLPGNTVSFASFARCETVDPEASLVYARFLSGVFSTELPRMSRIFEQLLTATDSSRSDDLRDEFIRESHQWLRGVPPANRTRSANDNASPLSNWLVAILRTARRNGFEVPGEMLSAFRTLIAVETIAFRLNPAVHLQSTGQEVLKDVLLEDVFRQFEPVKQRSALMNLLSALRGAPEYLAQIMTELAQSRLALNLVTTEHPHSATTRDRRSRLLAAAIAAVGVAWLMGEPGIPAVGSIPAARVLAVMLGVLYLCMIVLWRRLG